MDILKSSNYTQDLRFSCATVAVLVVVSCCSLVFSITWWRPKRLERQLRKQGLKGTSYRPFTGDMKEIASTRAHAMSNPIGLNHSIVPRVLPFDHKMTQKYGKVCMYWTGRKARLIVAEAEVLRSVLMDKDSHITNPPQNPLMYLLHRGISVLDGPTWIHRRKLITPAFALHKLKRMMPAFRTSCCELVDRWNEVAGAGCEVDVAGEFQNLTGDIIARTAFGSSHSEGKKIFELQEKLVVLLIQHCQSFYVPGFRFIPTRKNREMYSLDKKITGMLRDMIHRKEEAQRNGEVGDDNDDDLLWLLLKSKDEDENGLSMEDVIEECKLFYFAGQETSGALLTWAMILLSLHPHWQDKARNEVLQVCGHRTPHYESLAHHKIMQMILNEVLRMYPPVPFVMRYTEQSTDIGGMSIPAGVILHFPMILLHYDPLYWGEDVDEFKPERFAQGASNASKDGYYPFGWGPKICVGQNFALIEIKMALCMILQNFSFHLSPTYAHAPYHGFTLRPQHGAPIILHKL